MSSLRTPLPPKRKVRQADKSGHFAKQDPFPFPICNLNRRYFGLLASVEYATEHRAVQGWYTCTQLCKVGTPVHSCARLVHLYTVVQGWYTCTQLCKVGTPVHSCGRVVHLYTAMQGWYTCTQLCKVGTLVNSCARLVHL